MYRRVLLPAPVVIVWSCAAILLVVPLAGCGGGGDGEDAEPTPDIDQVSQLVGGLANLAEAGTWQRYFAAGFRPSDEQRRRYLQFNYVVLSAEVSGDTATVKARVEDPNGNHVGDMECACVREDGDWKLKSVPLPSGG